MRGIKQIRQENTSELLQKLIQKRDEKQLENCVDLEWMHDKIPHCVKPESHPNKNTFIKYCDAQARYGGQTYCTYHLLKGREQ